MKLRPILTVALTISLTLVAPVAADAQPAAKGPRVAFLGAESPTTNQHFVDAFRQGLRELGYVEGQNITIDERWGEGRVERFPDLVSDLVGLKVNVILAVSTSAALAAKTGTQTIPIVFIAGDPVSSGLVSSFARPGANLTGFSLALSEEFPGKWLELLLEAVPEVSRVAVLWNPANPAHAAYMKGLRDPAQRRGVQLQPQEVRDATQLDSAFGASARAQAQALIVFPQPLTVRYRARIVDLAAKSRLPAVYAFREFVDAGGLMAYGPNIPYMCRRAAIYVDKILKGAKPADLPVEQPTRFELLINLRTAKALSVKIPQSILIRADQVIE